MVVPGGGIALDDQRWIASRPRLSLPSSCTTPSSAKHSDNRRASFARSALKYSVTTGGTLNGICSSRI